MYGDLGISKEVLEYGARIEAALEDRFTEIDGNAEYNQLKVIAAMQKNRVSDIHFSGTTGYGYNDLGRETLEQVYADVFHTEDALVRPQIVCGTHALYTALAGNLRPGDELLSPVGKPYDTLEEVIGIRESNGSLREYGISYRQVDLLPDMVVGSLIKNPGGGLAPIGGYIAGTRQCIENAAYRLGSPGLGREVGASLGVNQSFFQGLFLAPTVVSGALKGAIFAANVYERLGFDVVPNSTEPRYDIIQAITFGKPEGVIAFCQGIQAAAPVDSYVSPEPWDMPGYDSQVIMAAGAFIQGSSIELSADGPIKPPYSVFFQGGLTWYHAKLGILMSLQKLLDAGIVKPEQLKID